MSSPAPCWFAGTLAASSVRAVSCCESLQRTSGPVTSAVPSPCVLSSHAPTPRQVLGIGCGTGCITDCHHESASILIQVLSTGCIAGCITDCHYESAPIPIQVLSKDCITGCITDCHRESASIPTPVLGTGCITDCHDEFATRDCRAKGIKVVMGTTCLEEVV